MTVLDAHDLVSLEMQRATVAAMAPMMRAFGDVALLPEVDPIDDQTGTMPPLTEEQTLTLALRKGALVAAGMGLVDGLVEELAAYGDDLDGGESLYLAEVFPERYAAAYGAGFLRAALATAYKVTADLADPEAGMATNIMEEMVRGYILRAGEQVLEDLEVDGDLWLEDSWLEDADFEAYYNGPPAQVPQTEAVAVVATWFEPFNSERYPHPSTQVPNLHLP